MWHAGKKLNPTYAGKHYTRASKPINPGVHEVFARGFANVRPNARRNGAMVKVY
jgi:hypothetical protein